MTKKKKHSVDGHSSALFKFLEHMTSKGVSWKAGAAEYNGTYVPGEGYAAARIEFENERDKNLFLMTFQP